jgi:thiol-disulfide isomerase/thioredoxin
MKQAIGVVLLCVSALAQAPAATEAEKQELAAAVEEANTSGFDMIRALETHLRKYPNTPLRPEIFNLIAKAAVETGDDARIVKYGEPTLAVTPNDVTLLDRVSRALLDAGGRENVSRALGYAKRYEDYVIRVRVPTGSDPVKNQEDHDRAMEAALLYQTRAYRILGDYDQARRYAALAYIAYPEESSARAWSEALEFQGKHEEAIARLADAFAIADPRASDEARSADRKQLGEMYRKLHDGSKKGLGDEILAAYDRTSEIMNKRTSQLRALDPNIGVTDPMKFTLGALGGGKLDLATMRGKVLIFDFWATWCVPCRAQHPLYEEVKRRFRDRNDVVFLAVDTDEDQQLVAPFLEAQHWSSNVFFDSELVRLLDISSIPATLIADKQGHLASRMDGFSASRFVDQLTARIQAALGAPDMVK